MHPSTALRDLTLQLAQAISDGDVAVRERYTSHHPGTAFLGTNPDEWWTDLAGLRRALVGQHEAGESSSRGIPWPISRARWGGRSIDGCASASVSRRGRSG